MSYSSNQIDFTSYKGEIIPLTTFMETSLYLQANKVYFRDLQGTLIGINHKNNLYKKEFDLLFKNSVKQDNPDFMRFINNTNSKKPICQDVKLYAQPERHLPSLNSLLSISPNYMKFITLNVL